MKPHPPGPGILGFEPLLHDLGPHPSGRSEFGNLFEEIEMGIEKKGKAWSKIIHMKPSFNGRLRVGDTVRQCESQFLYGRRTRFTDMITADTDRVPSGTSLVPNSTVSVTIRTDGPGDT